MAADSGALRRAYQGVLRRLKETQSDLQELPVLRKDLGVIVQESQRYAPEEGEQDVGASLDVLARRLDDGAGPEALCPRTGLRTVMGMVGKLLKKLGNRSQPRIDKHDTSGAKVDLATGSPETDVPTAAAGMEEEVASHDVDVEANLDQACADTEGPSAAVAAPEVDAPEAEVAAGEEGGAELEADGAAVQEYEVIEEAADPELTNPIEDVFEPDMTAEPVAPNASEPTDEAFSADTLGQAVGIGAEATDASVLDETAALGVADQAADTAEAETEPANVAAEGTAEARAAEQAAAQHAAEAEAARAAAEAAAAEEAERVKAAQQAAEQEAVRAAAAAAAAEEAEKLKEAQRAAEEEAARAAAAAAAAEAERVKEAQRAAEEEAARVAAAAAEEAARVRAAQQAAEEEASRKAAAAAAEAAALKRLQQSLDAAAVREQEIKTEIASAVSQAEAAARVHLSSCNARRQLCYRVDGLKAGLHARQLSLQAERAQQTAELSRLRLQIQKLQAHQKALAAQVDQQTVDAQPDTLPPALQRLDTSRREAAQIMHRSLSSARDMCKVRAAALQKSHKQLTTNRAELYTLATQRDARQRARIETLQALQEKGNRLEASSLEAALDASRKECIELKASHVAAGKTLSNLRSTAEALAETAWKDRRMAAAAPGLARQLATARDHQMDVCRQLLARKAVDDKGTEQPDAGPLDDPTLPIFEVASWQLEQLANKKKHLKAEITQALKASDSARLGQLLQVRGSLPWELGRAADCEEHGTEEGSSGQSAIPEAAGTAETADVSEAVQTEVTKDADMEGEDKSRPDDEANHEDLDDEEDCDDEMADNDLPCHEDLASLRNVVTTLKEYLVREEARALQFAESLNSSMESFEKDGGKLAHADAPLKPGAAAQGEADASGSGPACFVSYITRPVDSSAQESSSLDSATSDAAWEAARQAVATAEQKQQETSQSTEKQVEQSLELHRLQQELQQLRFELKALEASCGDAMAPLQDAPTAPRRAESGLKAEPGEIDMLRAEVEMLSRDARGAVPQNAAALEAAARKHVASAEAARTHAELHLRLWHDEAGRMGKLYQEALARREEATNALADWDGEHRHAGQQEQRCRELQKQLQELEAKRQEDVAEVARLEKACQNAEAERQAAGAEVEAVHKRRAELTVKNKQFVALSSQLNKAQKDLQKNQSKCEELRAELARMEADRLANMQAKKREVEELTAECKQFAEEANAAQAEDKRLDEDQATQRQQLEGELAEFEQESSRNAKESADRLRSLKANCQELQSKIKALALSEAEQVKTWTQEKISEQNMIQKRERWLDENRAKLQDLKAQQQPAEEDGDALEVVEATPTDDVSRDAEDGTQAASAAPEEAEPAEPASKVAAADSSSGLKRSAEAVSEDAAASELATKSARLDAEQDAAEVGEGAVSLDQAEEEELADVEAEPAAEFQLGEGLDNSDEMATAAGTGKTGSAFQVEENANEKEEPLAVVESAIIEEGDAAAVETSWSAEQEVKGPEDEESEILEASAAQSGDAPACHDGESLLEGKDQDVVEPPEAEAATSEALIAEEFLEQPGSSSAAPLENGPLQSPNKWLAWQKGRRRSRGSDASKTPRRSFGGTGKKKRRRSAADKPTQEQGDAFAAQETTNGQGADDEQMEALKQADMEVDDDDI
eukprot:TRINITY_DN14638_c0_g1_i1.p1 TRINITY_DN14638_c0_g1~~TRINITY_DN14638_c0_g1_i1.p1  ORF type:complete len:1696 (+),score=565.67 TRINITY_DN14638_c0_g1_i1:87-5090(+)